MANTWCFFFYSDFLLCCPDRFDKWCWWENVGAALNTSSVFWGGNFYRDCLLFVYSKCFVACKPELQESKATSTLATRGADLHVKVVSGVGTETVVEYSTRTSKTPAHTTTTTAVVYASI